MIPDKFLELYYGKYETIDLHNKQKEEARASLVYILESLDADIKSLVIIHGYLHGTVIKKFVRDEFSHRRVAEKVNLDAGRTIFLIKN